MKYTPVTVGLGLSLILLFSCSKPAADEDQTSGDTLAIDESSMNSEAVQAEPLVADIVDYYISIDEDVEIELASFKPLEELLTLTRETIYFKDSVGFARAEKGVPRDSTVYMSRVDAAYDRILVYQKSMKAGIKLSGSLPMLSDPTRAAGEADKTADYLPTALPSLFSNGHFFFLGGAPFIERKEGAFSGPGGKPESHYGTSITENANYFFNSIYHETAGPVTVTFGPALNTYESVHEIKGIGSLIHTFHERIPVFFITEKGPVAAQLISTSFKLAPQGMGCISDQPYYEFACAENVEPNDILFVFVPYAGESVERVHAVRENRAVWVADIDGDEIPDFAGVAGTFEGISDDGMNEVLWYANINGKWQIIDFGTDPDCT
jgi:hypothetical protein